ncbi:MAG: hypothetical protein EON54_03825 [Alcaligenaceae bacterium]|nr:MAG: hypothetical protein EON54_03825 [Alcaligenaceae bacterium]
MPNGYDDFLPQAGPAIEDPSEGNMALDLQAKRLAARKQALVEQAQQAKALQERVQGRLVPSGPRFTEIYVASPKAAAFLPLAHQIGSQYQQKLLDEDTSAHEKTVSTYALAHLKKAPPPDADESTKLTWAQEGSQIPGLKPVMDAFMSDQLIKQPERVEARAERTHEKEMARTEAQRRQADELAYRRQRDEEGNTLRRDLNAAVAARGGQGTWQKMGEDADGNQVLYNPTTKERQTVSGVAPAPKALTPTQQDKRVDSADLIGKLKDVRSTFTDNMSGSLRSWAMGNETLPLGKYLGTQGDSDIARTWGLFRTITNQIRHGLFGASLTKGEKAAFDSTTVDSYTKPEEVKRHLDTLIGYAEKAARRQEAQDRGGKMDQTSGAVVMRNGQVAPGTESAEPVGKFTGLDNPTVRQSLEAAISQIADPNEKDRATRALQSQLGGSSGGATGSWEARSEKPKFKIIGVR